MRRFALMELLSLCATVQAQESRDCYGRANTSHETAVCAAKEGERLDKELNAVYRQALTSIDQREDLPEGMRTGVKKTLRDAQRRWIDFRKLDCQAFSDSINGTGHAIGFHQCMNAHTEARIQQLRERW